MGSRDSLGKLQCTKQTSRWGCLALLPSCTRLWYRFQLSLKSISITFQGQTGATVHFKHIKQHRKTQEFGWYCLDKVKQGTVYVHLTSSYYNRQSKLTNVGWYRQSLLIQERIWWFLPLVVLPSHDVFIFIIPCLCQATPFKQQHNRWITWWKRTHFC